MSNTKALITGTEQHENSIICTGVVGLVSPAARTTYLHNYHLVYICFMLIWQFSTWLHVQDEHTKWFHSAKLSNNKQSTQRENLDSTLRSYPFVTPSTGYMYM